MKRILLLPCLLTLIAGAAVAQESSSWKRYTVKGEEFSVKLPTMPSLTTSTDFMKPEMRQRVQRHFGAYADGIVYTIYSVDDGNQQKMLKRSSGGTGSSLRWDPATEQYVTRDGFAGKQYTSQNPLGGAVQVFATANHFYLFQAFGAPADDARVQQFFSSLKLGPAPEGIEVSDGEGIPWEPAAGSSYPESAEKTFSGKEVDRKALIVSKIEPTYTEEARQNQVTGTVVLRAVLSSRGSVINITRLSELPHGLTENSINATRQMKFIPATKDGKFVSCWIQLEFNFSLF